MDEDMDARLVMQAQAGDKAAFGQLIERHQRMVHALAASMITARENAHDLAQEALLQAYLRTPYDHAIYGKLVAGHRSPA